MAVFNWLFAASCFRAGQYDDSVGPYFREYKEASSSDNYIEVVDALEYTRQCAPGTYFVFSYCQCITCPVPMPTGKICCKKTKLY